MKAFIKVIKRTSNIKNVIEYLEKMVNLNSSSDEGIDAIASYNFFNNYYYDWSQNDYLDN